MVPEKAGIFNLALVEQVGGVRRGSQSNITVTNLEGSWQSTFPKKSVLYVVSPTVPPGFLWCDHTTDPSKAAIVASSRKELKRLRGLMLNPKVPPGEQSYDGSY